MGVKGGGGSPSANFNVNWATIEAEYRSGMYTISQLSKRHNVPYSSISAKISRKGWVKDDQVRHQMVQEEVSKIMAAEYTDDAKDIALAIQNARKSLLHISRKLDVSDVDAKELKALSETNKADIETIMKVRGLLNEKQAVEDMTEEQLRSELTRLQALA